LFPENGTRYEELLKNADVAMYKAKELGKNNFQYFNEEMNTEAKKRLELDNGLRNAIKDDGFTLNYQPKCSCEGKKVVGFEALIRWNDPKLGFVPPDEFIPIAEHLGYIYEIGLWVIERAFIDLKEFMKQDKELVMAINVSIKQLEHISFLEDVKNLLEKNSVSPKNVEFEITETAVMENINTILPTLEAVRNMGISLSIDDFGTGYSSLMYLKKMPIDVLKIDREFVDNIDKDNDDKAIVEATVLMAKTLKLKTVAEGVERKEHLDILSNMGCDNFQGYYFSKPLKFNDAKEILLK
jgi:EAL domain-containing protein (putative c-di-GMP-specific phosphodiesterase class I)